MPESNSEANEPQRPEESGKKPYSSPVLSRYGLIKDLTTGGSGINGEMGMGMGMGNDARFP